MDNEKLKKFITTTLDQLKSEKAPIEEKMKEACAYLEHRTMEPHSKVPKITVHTDTPKDAINTCVHGIAGYLLSPSIRWFKYVTKGENFEKSDTLYGAEDWLENVTTLQYSLYSNSRFYATSTEALRDAIITGTSYEMVSDRIATDKKIVFDVYNPFECYIAENASGTVDTFFREYSMTAKQAYDRFGEDLPEEVKRLLRDEGGNPYQECTFVHAIYPRKDYLTGLVASKSKRFASVHYSKMGDAIIQESGYDDFPLAIHRWRKLAGTPYGLGLVMDHIAEIRKLDDREKQLSIAIQFQGTPTIYAPEHLKGRFVFRPGYVNFGPLNLGKPEPLQTQFNIDHARVEVQELRNMVSRLLYADLFNILMRQERQRTAYEVQEIKGEGLILLSAIIGNMQDEKLSPLVLRTFRIMFNSGLLPQPPEELVKASASGRVNIELDGPLAQTMKAYHQATGLEQGLAAIAAGVQIFPNAIVNFDEDEILRQYATAKGIPQSCVREVADVKKIKEQQAQIQAEQEQQAQALQQSQVLKNLGYNAASAMGAGHGMQQQSLPGGVM